MSESKNTNSGEDTKVQDITLVKARIFDYETLDTRCGFIDCPNKIYEVKTKEKKFKNNMKIDKNHQNTKTKMENTDLIRDDFKYASIRNNLKLRNRFHHSTNLQENDSKHLIKEKSSCLPNYCPKNNVKNLSQMFEQRCCNENQDSIKRRLYRKNNTLKNNWKSKKTEKSKDETTNEQENDKNAKIDSYSIQNEENQSTIGNNIEEFRKSIVGEISKSFHSEDDDDDVDGNFDEKDFNQIESSFREMENAILQMQAQHFYENKCDVNSEYEQATEETNSIKNTPIVDHSHKQQIQKSPEDPGYLIVIDNNSQDEDEDFGKRNFERLDDINFLEAYNRPGSELILTQVGQILRRSLSKDYTSISNYSQKPFPEEVFNPDDIDGYLNCNLIRKECEDEINISTTTENNYFNFDYDQDSSKRLASETDSAGSEAASNRSTYYSISENSDEENNSAEDYNNVQLRNKTMTYEKGIRTETYYNSQQNPVIEKVCQIDSPFIKNSEAKYKIKKLDQTITRVKEKNKKDYLIEELINTEKKYILDLEKIVKEYMPYFLDETYIPRHLLGKSRIIFGNIKKIYLRTKAFYGELKNCEDDPELIAETFLEFEHLFTLYPSYSKNKPKADNYIMRDFREYVIDRQKHLGDRLGLASYLLTPIQRLGKYILLLEQIQRELTKEATSSNKIHRAIEMIRKQMSRGNDFIAIDSIKESPIDLTEQGSFIMREKFNILKPRKFEAMLFLFEQIIVFTSPDSRNSEVFIYRDSISLDEMGIVTFENQPLVFHLKRFPSYKSATKENVEFVIEAKRKKDKKVWTEQIEKRLWEQLHKCKEEQIKLQGNKSDHLKSAKPVLGRLYSTSGNSSPLEPYTKERRKSTFYFDLENEEQY